jgi:hypothetical protein
MRAHKLFDIIKGLPEHETYNDVKRLIELYPFITEFSFGKMDNISKEETLDLYFYSIELIRNNLFQLPFPICYYEFSFVDYIYNVIVSIAEDKVIVSHGFVEQDKDFIAYVGSESFENNGKISSDDHTHFLNPRYEFGPEVWDEEKAMKYFFDAMTTGVLSLTSLLNAQGVETIRTPAPDRLNKHRVAAGKYPIKENNEIRIRVGKQLRYVSGNEVGNHASPRMHWRRGHIRHLPDGKITNVRPCLVGSIGEPVKKVYKVEA